MSTESEPESESENGSKSDTDIETDSSSTPSTTARRSLWARLVGLGGVAIVGAGFWLAAEEPGLIAAAVIGLSWYLLLSPYAVALGHAAFLPLATGTLPSAPAPELLVAEAGLAILLVAPAIDTDAPGAFIGLFLGSLAGLAGLGAATYWWSTRLWAVALVLLGALAVAGYALYRYELVRLGLVETDPV